MNTLRAMAMVALVALVPIVLGVLGYHAGEATGSNWIAGLMTIAGILFGGFMLLLFFRIPRRPEEASHDVGDAGFWVSGSNEDAEVETGVEWEGGGGDSGGGGADGGTD
jgi:cytochrome c biogenesis protein CcdA